MTSKYHNVRNTLAGENYSSLRERNRHLELILEQRAGRLSNLRREVSFELAPKAKVLGKLKRSLRYVADFVYERDGALVVEDCKGFRTAMFRLKAHLLKTGHGIDILLT